MPAAQAPILVATEWWRSDRFAPSGFTADHITFPLGLQFAMGGIIGWLVNRLAQEAAARPGARLGGRSAARPARAPRRPARRREPLRRALGSSLEIEEAFRAFIRELRGLVPFDRTAIMLADDGVARVIAAAGAAAETVFPPGTRRPVAGSLLSR